MRGFPVRYVVYDTETNAVAKPATRNTIELTWKLGAAVLVDPVSYQQGEPVWIELTESRQLHEMMAALLYDKEPVWVFAHNHGFDARIAGWFRELSNGRYSLLPDASLPGAYRFKTPLFIAANPPFLVRLFRPDGQQILLCDTYQWFDMSVHALGEKLGTPKLDTPDPAANDKEWMRYCRRDVLIVWAALQKLWAWLKEMGVSDWEVTRAAQAYAIWNRRYKRKGIVRPQDPDCLAMDRHAFYGGRVEPYFRGMVNGPCHQIDINSLYPHVMMHNLYPSEVVAYNPRLETTPPDAITHPYSYTAEVYINSPDKPYPVRCRDGVWWCRGKVRTILPGPELSIAFGMGHVFHVGRWVRFKMSRLFYEYVRYFWDLRRKFQAEGDEIGQLTCKYMMNSLFGKFGQKDGKWLYRGKEKTDRHYGQGMIVGVTPEYDREWRMLAGQLYERFQDQESPTAFVPIASFVTSYARLLMDNCKYMIRNDNVLYQATDSFLVTDQGRQLAYSHGLVKPQNLGCFKESGSWQNVYIHGIGALDLDEARIRPGIKPKSQRVAPEVWQQEVWEGAEVGIFAGNCDSVSIRNTLIRTSTAYQRGITTPDGWVMPHSIDNWDLTPEHQAKHPIDLNRQ